MAFETPIAFCIFNRPKQTERVFRSIAREKPKRLLIIGDGPRQEIPTEAERVKKCRSIVAQVDWPCDVSTNFAATNMGCRQRMASGISWAFAQEEELIVLEDDCRPDASFFTFCEKLLRRYRDDDRVMMISGNNFQPCRRSSHSYFFSRYTHIWGWASWRRAWQHYDLEMKSWPGVRSTRKLARHFESADEYAHWERVFNQQHQNTIDTWDFAWMYACLEKGGLTILPETNLVSNLGFGDDATHTLDESSPLANLQTNPLYSLHHPAAIIRNAEADRWTFENILSGPSPASQPRKFRGPKAWVKKFLRLSQRQAA